MPTRHPWLAAALSGLLCGLSFPSFAHLHLEPLAWVCWVPWLLAMRGPVTWWRGLLGAYLALALATAIATRWLLVSPGVGFFVFTVQAALMLPVPAVFLALRRRLGWHRALWVLPPLWTGWEWLLTLQPLHTPLAYLGYSQAQWYRLIQYADLVGVWGITCWLMLFNVLVARLWPAVAQSGASGRRAALLRLGAAALAMVAVPGAYGWYRIGTTDAALAQAPRIQVALLQPNRGPGRGSGETADSYVKVMERMVIRSTEAILATHPDLVVWPEGSLPFDVPGQVVVRDYLLTVVERWNRPLILGFQEGRDPAPLYNAALLITPQLARYAQGLPAGREVRPKVYRKQELVPFSERVPFADRFPSLAALAPALDGKVSHFTPGERDATLFAFLDQTGAKRWAGVRICYEVLYPRGTARLAARGAQVLALLSNDHLFGRSRETFQIAAYSRILAITTRRSIVRSADTGLTVFVDPVGRLYGAVPWWEEQVAVAPVVLNDVQTPYVRWPDALPIACLVLTALGLAGASRLKPLPLGG